MEEVGECKLSEELILLCNSKGQGEDPDLLLDAFTIIENSKDFPSFFWCLSNLHNFQHEKVREFAIGNIRKFLFSSWSQIPETIYPLLIEVFTTIFQDPNYQDNKFKLPIFKSLTLIAHGLYPSHWPGFFDFIIQLPKPDFYCILQQLNYSMLDSASVYRRDIDGFKNATLVDGSQAKILNVIVFDALNGIEGANEALRSTINWIDLSLVLNSELISAFVQMLTQEPTLKSGLSIFISIFTRALSLDVQFELVTQLQLTNIIAQIASSSQTDSEIICLCSELSFHAFHTFCSSLSVTMAPLIEAVADISINLYMFPDKKSTNFNSGILRQIFKFHQEYVGKYFEPLIVKVSSSIALTGVDSDMITSTSLTLLMDAAKYAEIDIVPPLLNLTQRLSLPENIVEIATLISAFNRVLMNFEDPDNQLLIMLIPMFSPLLELQPPFEQPHYVAMDQYMALIRPVFEDLPPDFQAAAIIKFVEFMMTPNEEGIGQIEKKSICDNFTLIAESVPELIVNIPGIKPVLPQFIQTGNLSLIKAGSYIVSSLDPSERLEFYSNIIPAFTSLLSESEQTDAYQLREILRRIFSFWIYSKTDDLPDIQSILFQFFQSIYTPNMELFKNITLFSDFCQGSVNTLGPAAFPIFWGTSKYITEFNNASAIVKAGLSLAANPPYGDEIVTLFHFINEVLKSRSSFSRIMMKADENQDKKTFFELAIQFFILIIPNMPDEAIKNEAIANLVDLMNRDPLPTNTIDSIIQLFMTDPQSFVVLTIDGVFHAFMGILYEFYSHPDEDEDQKKLIVDMLKLLKLMFQFAPDMDWNSPTWKLLDPIAEDGIDILLKILTSEDDKHFEKSVKDLFNYLHPPQIDSGFIADAEDDAGDFEETENE